MRVPTAALFAFCAWPVAALALDPAAPRSLLQLPPPIVEATASVRQTLEVARSRLSAQRDAVVATEVRAAECRDRFQAEDVAVEAGLTRLDAYRRCIAGREG